MSKSPIIYNGKKARLIPKINPLYPNIINNYYEPFCGGASVFFDLYSQNVINGNYYLSDLNWRILRLYEIIRDDLSGLDSTLQYFLTIPNKENLFYYLRSIEDISIPNNNKVLPPFSLGNSNTKLAAKDLFLNRMTKNGWRENQAGQFNLPYYSARKPDYFYQPSNLASCSKVFNDSRVYLTVEDYQKIESRLVVGDFVYLDPPYEPASSTANFTSYTCNGFGQQEQKDLAQFVNRIDSKGVKFILSNSLAAINLYSNPKFNIQQIQTKGYKANPRYEILVSN